jgi:hypothetical protein
MPRFGSTSGFGSAIENGDTTPPRCGEDHIDGAHTSIIHLMCGPFDPNVGDRGIDIHGGLTMPGDSEITEDSLAPARSIIFGAALSVPLWAIVSLGAYAMFH